MPWRREMFREGFSAEKYIEEQSKYILERIHSGEGRLYLEFGGKLVEDKHAKRVLPGFDENAKIKLLQRMGDKAEIIICIYAGDIIKSKTRQDFGITYDLEVMRLIDEFRSYELEVNSVVVTRYEDAPSVNQFLAKLERRGIRTYKHMYTKGYPTDVDTIVSEEGYGANPYIEVTKPLIVVTGPEAQASSQHRSRRSIMNTDRDARQDMRSSRPSRSGVFRSNILSI